tara:strand:+ start:1600 stop:3825 length:2226 start_codon:yes stop_codon:yes gene_type:complete
MLEKPFLPWLKFLALAGSMICPWATAVEENDFLQAKLPDPVTSFGACRAGHFLYVYGGHVGQAHAYSKANHSLHFGRMNLRKKGKWEKLPFNKPLQGFGMAAHKGNIYVAGGSRATNEKGKASNLSSVDEVFVYSPVMKTWKALTPLPEPRSSHELVSHKGKLYVIGGWQMKDGQGVTWHKSGWVADLSQSPIQWEKLPSTKWAVRANGAAIAGEFLYVIGGLEEKKGVTNAVRRLNLASGQWSDGPDYPGPKGMKSFGSAAINLKGRLIAGAFSSTPRILSGKGDVWIPNETKLKERRFFHRMVPLDGARVLFLGGANYDGHLDSLEILSFPLLENQKGKQPDSFQNPGKRQSNWPAIRGQGDSHAEAKELPLTWSDDKNIAWRMKLSGYGQSTPIVWGDKLFCTWTKGDFSEESVIACHRLADGKSLWIKSYPSPVKTQRSKMVSQAAPSPVVDAKGVYFFFENGLMVALNHAGKELWKRSLTKDYGPIDGNHGIGSSLVQSAGHLGLLVDHGGPSYLLKIHKATGKTTWKVDRPKRVSWSTPTLARKGEGEILFISSNGIAEAYDFEAGKRLWIQEDVEGNTVASPTLTEEFVIIGSSAPDQSMALRREENLQGKNRLAWVAEEGSSSFGSPLATDNHVYFVNRAGVASCHEIKTGKKLWNLRLPGSCWASPIWAKGRIYFFVKEGSAVVLADDGSDRVLAENKLTIEGRIYGVAAVDQTFVIRTGSELIALRTPQES